jgi:hypothetical protein
MTNEIDVTHIRNLDVTANPAAVSLTAIGAVLVLLSLSNAGVFGVGSMVLAMAFLYGGLAPIIGGLMEWKKNNTFGLTTFLSFGFFFLSFVGLLVLPKLGLATPESASGMAAYFAIWGLITFVLFIASLKTIWALKLVLGLITLLLFLLAIGAQTGNATVTTVAGYEGILTGFVTIYAGLAQVLNEVYGKTVAPVGG